MYNVSNDTLKVGQAVQYSYKACALSLKAAEIFRSINESSPPLPSFSTFHFLFPISLQVFAVEQFRILRWKANEKMNLMIVSEIKIECLQPEKLRNMFERIQKMKKSRTIVFRFLFAISSRVFAVE